MIFDARNLNAEWTEGEVAGMMYGLSDKGWVDTELSHGWLVDHYLKHAVSVRPLFLLLDGHSSHFQPDLIHFAKDHNIIFECVGVPTFQWGGPIFEREGSQKTSSYFVFLPTQRTNLNLLILPYLVH